MKPKPNGWKGLAHHWKPAAPSKQTFLRYLVSATDPQGLRFDLQANSASEIQQLVERKVAQGWIIDTASARTVDVNNTEEEQ